MSDNQPTYGYAWFSSGPWASGFKTREDAIVAANENARREPIAMGQGSTDESQPFWTAEVLWTFSIFDLFSNYWKHCERSAEILARDNGAGIRLPSNAPTAEISEDLDCYIRRTARDWCKRNGFNHDAPMWRNVEKHRVKAWSVS